MLDLLACDEIPKSFCCHTKVVKGKNGDFMSKMGIFLKSQQKLRNPTKKTETISEF